MFEEKDLMTSQEASQAFIDAGLSAPTFHRRVRNGEIESILLEGKQRGAMYPRNQVMAAIRKRGEKYRRKIKKTTSTKTSTFSQATPTDMVDIAPLLIAFYGSRISIEKRAAWIERNPEVCFMLKSEGEVVGCAFIMPLEEAKIIQILSSQVKPPTRPHEILLYEPGKHVNLYVRAVGVTQAVSKEQRRHWAANLIARLAKAIIALGDRGVYVEKIYAQGDTKTGEKALRALGFTQIEIPAPTSRKNYMLDITQSGTPFAMKYKARLNVWRAMNEEE